MAYGYVNGEAMRTRDEYVCAVRGFGPIGTDEELMAFAEKASHNWLDAGWRRPFIDFYLGDYALDEPKASLTDKEYARLKEIQKAMRDERDRVEAERMGRYDSGAVTREDMVFLLDAEIENKDDGFWKDMARSHKEHVLKVYDTGGEPVGVAMIDHWYEDGYDYEKWLYTDGSLRTLMFGAD